MNSAGAEHLGIKLTLPFSGWAFIGGCVGSFQNMLTDFLDTEGAVLAFPNHLLEEAQSDQEKFLGTLATVHNHLASIANDGTESMESDWVPDPDSSALVISSVLSLQEFATLWMAWRAFALLFNQEAQGETLKMPYDQLPSPENISAFNTTLVRILRKNPVVKMDNELGSQGGAPN